MDNIDAFQGHKLISDLEIDKAKRQAGKYGFRVFFLTGSEPTKEVDHPEWGLCGPGMLWSTIPGDFLMRPGYIP